MKMQSNDEEINMKTWCLQPYLQNEFYGLSKQNKIKSHTWNQSRGTYTACVINSLPININSRTSFPKHIIQMRRTCRSRNYLRFRTGTNLLTAFSIETTLVEWSRGFFRLWLLLDDTWKENFSYYGTFLRFCDPSWLQPSCKLLSQPTEIINELIKSTFCPAIVSHQRISVQQYCTTGQTVSVTICLYKQIIKS